MSSVHQNWEPDVSAAGDAKELVPRTMFRWCPPGTFLMGSPQSELGYGDKRYDCEDQVSVELTKGFWMSETEVTQEQWLKLMGTSPWHGKDNAKEAERNAASYISYEDAISYCLNLTAHEQNAGRLKLSGKISLPTEAQWEYACRAGTNSKYQIGESDAELSDYAWFDKNASRSGEPYPHEVGLKKPNAWGLKDMCGNLFEWCSDWYAETLVGGREPEGPKTGSSRVNRGGCWRLSAPYCRSAYRDKASPVNRYDDLGFRLCVVLK